MPPCWNKLLGTRLGTAAAGLLQKASASELFRRILKNSFWAGTSIVFMQALNLISSIVVVRILGKDMSGALDLLASTFQTIGLFAGMGLGMTANKHIAEFRDTDPDKAGRIIGMLYLCAGLASLTFIPLTIIFAADIADLLMKQPELAAYLKWSSGLLLLNAVNGIQIGVMSGLEAFREQTFCRIWIGVSAIVFNVALTFLYGMPGAVAALLASGAVQLAVYNIAIRRKCRTSGIPIHYRSCMRELPVIWKFAVPVLISGMMLEPVDLVLKAMLARMPGGLGQLGILSVVNRWRQPILQFPTILSQATMPVCANLYGTGQTAKFRRVVWINLLIMSGSSAAVGIVVALCSPLIMMAYGKEFAGDWLPLAIACAGAVFFASNLVVGQAIWSMNLANYGMGFAIFRGVILVVLFTWMRRWGASGFYAAIAFTLGILFVVQTVWLAARMKKLALKETVKA